MMPIQKRFFLVAALVLIADSAIASERKLSKYAGQEQRAITSLSANDIAELRQGGGWGLAKPAELNGIPGPAHLLELADQIPLSELQVVQITKLREEMKSKAIPLGERLIALERQLDLGFQSKLLTPDLLRVRINEIGEVRQELRFVHLSTHFKTPNLLSTEQIEKYNELRGYNLSGSSVGAVGHGQHGHGTP